MIIRDIEQGTPEWHALRVGVVTASRFKDVLAKGRGNAVSKTREAYAYQIATETITGKSADDTPVNDWMRRGCEREDQARALYELQHSVAVETVTFCYLNDERSVGCSPDGLVGDDGLLEIKSPRLATHVGYMLGGKCPTEYKAQVQGQLWVSGRDWCDFVTYCPESHIELWRVRVERDEEYIAELAEAVAQFWTRVEEIRTQLENLAA